jgi:outer membrane biosynthesis protein TonB
MHKIICVSFSVLLLMSGIANAQSNTQAKNPYLEQMQQTLNQANTKAMTEFNNQFPKPEPSAVQPLKGSKPTTMPNNNPPVEKQQQAPAATTATPNNTTTAPDVAVTEQKKDNKGEVYNIFGHSGSSNTSTSGADNQAQGSTNIFR